MNFKKNKKLISRGVIMALALSFHAQSNNDIESNPPAENTAGYLQRAGDFIGQLLQNARAIFNCRKNPESPECREEKIREDISKSKLERALSSETVDIKERPSSEKMVSLAISRAASPHESIDSPELMIEKPEAEPMDIENPEEEAMVDIQEQPMDEEKLFPINSQTNAAQKTPKISLEKLVSPIDSQERAAHPKRVDTPRPRRSPSSENTDFFNSLFNSRSNSNDPAFLGKRDPEEIQQEAVTGREPLIDVLFYRDRDLLDPPSDYTVDEND